MTRIGAATLLLFTLPASAQWLGKGEVGLVVASGNTEARTSTVKLGVTRNTDDWKNALAATTLNAADATGTTANRWEASGQSDYNFGQRNFWFGAGRYEDDNFSGFEFQSTVSLGLGRRFIQRPGTQFSGTAGVGYKVFETRDTFDTDGTLQMSGERDQEAIFRSTLELEQGISTTTKLLDKLVLESGVDNTFVRNEVSVQVQITDVLALAVAYSIRHNTKPPNAFENTDTLTTINLVGEIK